ncbi:MAG: HDIG domain-containing protein [Candidatus Omnitrophica bacterium]|nr:HDIG domain-containing protein [Candidatus Omnitrophota bacterium]
MNKLINTKKFKEIATRKQTISVLMIAVFFAVTLASMFISPKLSHWKIHEGDIALKTIYAPYDFVYYWEIDDEATEKARNTASENVPFYAERDLVLEERIRTEIDDVFSAIEEQKEMESPVNEKVVALEERLKEKVPERDLKVLIAYPNTAKLQNMVLNVLDNLFLAGYASEEDLQLLRQQGEEEVMIFNGSMRKQMRRETQALLGGGELEKVAEEYASKQFPGDRRTRKAAASLVTAYIEPNIKLDLEKTERMEQAAREKVEPVYRRWEVKKNELVIEKGERVNARHIAQISQLRSIFRPGITPKFFFGVILLFMLLGLVAGIHAHFTVKADFLKKTKELSIILITMFLMILAADLIIRSPQPSYFIPLASMGMIITLLVSFNISFLFVVLLSVLISLLMGGDIEVALVLLVGSVVGMAAVKGARRRGQILWAGLLVGAAKLFSISCIGLINGMGMDFYVREGAWAMASGILSGFIVMGLLPVFEHVFKVPTNISLLELSDLNHPLLKRLAMEAPGTYHHSIMVGNLAEAACDAIGANSLLARVGSYYHDIGKITKAEYFSENEMGAGSKHLNLAPSMSALIIAKHVKEGVEMARQYKLNKTIVDFINHHHGDSLIAYFYQKAIEKSEDGKVLREEDFRYPGPRPQTKESAIVLLADSVEASSRSLEEPTPASIRNLVRKIINNKFIDGQLDECDLTLKDMHVIADSFVRVLMGIFHTRLNYPEPGKKQSNGSQSNDNKNKQRKPKQKKKD